MVCRFVVVACVVKVIQCRHYGHGEGVKVDRIVGLEIGADDILNRLTRARAVGAYPRRVASSGKRTARRAVAGRRPLSRSVSLN
ncbi:hypothetical protein KCP75_18590 [Salmonella enterica subsp. enterica]|nr:hypothetical protein KCP75_18590 [Salmonella enterica subsp. enterica]